MRTTTPSEINSLTYQEKQALTLLRQRLSLVFQLSQLIIYGSKARGDYDEWSDLDVLVLVEDEKNWHNRVTLSDIVYEINMQLETQLTCILENITEWQLEKETVWLPLKDNIIEEGIVIEVS